jgi:hypothetical protein
MSDSEDDGMDVDDTLHPELAEKGKRLTSDLPVEAQDSLPWVEKYRPDTLADVQGHQDILATINKFVESNVWRCFYPRLANHGSVSHTSSSMDHPERGRRPQSLLLRDGYTGSRTYGRWC